MANMRPSCPLPSTPMVASGQNRLGLHGSSSARTLAACSSRNARSFSRNAGSWLARIATASSAAFVRARLADRQRAHRNAARHLHDGKQRIHAFQRLRSPPARRAPAAACGPPPFRARCAAPPAPAMITCNPRASAPEAYSAIHCGVRCAETTGFRAPRRNAPAFRRRARIVSQSDLLPMMMPTQRAAFAVYCPCASV